MFAVESEKVEHTSKKESASDLKTSTEPACPEGSEKLVNGSTEAREVGSNDSCTTIDVKEDVLVNGNAKTTEDVIHQVSCMNVCKQRKFKYVHKMLDTHILLYCFNGFANYFNRRI